MDWDEVRQAPGKAVVLGEDLRTHSIAELEARIAALEAEIARVANEIAGKRRHEAAASALFKGKG